MADERVQPGAEVSKAEYEQFKEFVQDLHGSLRGNLGRELELAMREYRQQERGRDKLTRIEDDVASIKAMLADGQADGGTRVPLPDAESHTHTAGADSRADSDPDRDDPVPIPDEQPHHRASSRRDRAAWLYAWVRDEIGASGQVHRNVLAKRASKTWGYDTDSDVTADLVDQALDLMGRVWDVEDHPTNDGMVVWGDRADEVWDAHSSDQQDAAADRMDDLDAGHPDGDA